MAPLVFRGSRMYQKDRQGPSTWVPCDSPATCGRDAQHGAFASPQMGSLRGTPPPPSSSTSRRRHRQLEGRGGGCGLMRREKRRKKGEMREECRRRAEDGAQTAGPAEAARENASPAGLERAGTFRRKLATTCSKGYLYTCCTSTVTPIPRARPAAANAEPPELCAGRRRPNAGGQRGVVFLFLLLFQTFETLLSTRRNRQEVKLPPPSANVQCGSPAGGAGWGGVPRPPRPRLQLLCPGTATRYPAALDFGTCAFVSSPRLEQQSKP